MARDNEKIIAILSESQQFQRQKLIELINAEAKLETLRGFIESMGAVECAANNLGDRGYYPDSPDAIYAIAREAITPIEKRIQEMIDRIEGGLRSDG